MLDQAVWRGANAFKIPPCLTLVALPPRSSELNPVERLWLYLKQKYPSFRVLDHYGAIEDASCQAWQNLVAEPARLKSLSSCPWIMSCVKTERERYQS